MQSAAHLHRYYSVYSEGVMAYQAASSLQFKCRC
jgi:hypothetical protein